MRLCVRGTFQGAVPVATRRAVRAGPPPPSLATGAGVMAHVRLAVPRRPGFRGVSARCLQAPEAGVVTQVPLAFGTFGAKQHV